MNTTFLNYTGEYEEISEEKFSFTFKNGEDIIMTPSFICPMVYDNPFKTVFSYDKSGMELVKDCLNSILYPISQMILEITSFAPKEFQTSSNVRYGKGAKRVDDAFFVKIKDGDGFKIILIDLEMEKKFNNSLTEKFYDYGNSLRRANNFTETWVIAFCIDDVKVYTKDKGSKSNLIKQYNLGGSDTLPYIKIYEIYLNDLYNNIDKNISVFPNEFIQEEGKEWIKLFTITLWSNYYKTVEKYPLPSEITFRGKKIKEAIDKINMNNIDDTARVRILTNIRFENQVKEENEKNLAHEYQRGKQEGDEEGYQRGKQENDEEAYQRGKQEGRAEGYQIGGENGFTNGQKFGRQNLILEQLDTFYSKYIQGKSIENIDVIKKIPSQLVNERYSGLEHGQDFIKQLAIRNLLS